MADLPTKNEAAAIAKDYKDTANQRLLVAAITSRDVIAKLADFNSAQSKSMDIDDDIRVIADRYFKNATATKIKRTDRGLEVGNGTNEVHIIYARIPGPNGTEKDNPLVAKYDAAHKNEQDAHGELRKSVLSLAREINTKADPLKTKDVDNVTGTMIDLMRGELRKYIEKPKNDELSKAVQPSSLDEVAERLRTAVTDYNSGGSDKKGRAKPSRGQVTV